LTLVVPGSGEEQLRMLRDFDHVVLFCADTERSRAWYEKIGFSYLRGYEGMRCAAIIGRS
jgi:hypothetical protein